MSAKKASIGYLVKLYYDGNLKIPQDHSQAKLALSVEHIINTDMAGAGIPFPTERNGARHCL
jgi:hypothetical protein